jgi:hypothetical protein
MFTGYPGIYSGGYAMLFMDNYAGQRQCFINNGSTTAFSNTSLLYFEANSTYYYYNPMVQISNSNVPFLLECAYSTSGPVQTWGNGVTSSGPGGSAHSTGSSQWFIGGGNGGGQPINGCIGEMIMYNTASLTTAQRQQVESYLIGKWGIDPNASLISNSSSPTTIYAQSIYNQVPSYINGVPYLTWSGSSNPYYLTGVSTPTSELYTNFVMAVLDPTLKTTSTTWAPIFSGVLQNASPGWSNGGGSTWSISNNPPLVATAASIAFSLSSASSQFITDPSGMGPLGAFTIDVWFNPTFAARTAPIVCETGSSVVASPGYVKPLIDLSNDGNIYVAPYNLNPYTYSVGAYTSNQWYNVVITNTGGVGTPTPPTLANSSLVYYLNGVKVGSVAYVRNPPSPLLNVAYTKSFFTIGWNPSIGYLDAQIGGFKAYCVALSSNQIKQNYNAWAWRFGLSRV